MEYYFLGLLSGIIISIILGILETIIDKLKTIYTARRFKPKSGDYVASYTHMPIETWMIEDYSELFAILNVGKKFIKIKVVDSSYNPNRIGSVYNIERGTFFRQYIKYTGTKARLNTIEDIINDN